VCADDGTSILEREHVLDGIVALTAASEGS